MRRAIGYVPQSSGVDRDATGRENLMLQGRVQGMSGRALESRVGEMLDDVVHHDRGVRSAQREVPIEILRAVSDAGSFEDAA